MKIGIIGALQEEINTLVEDLKIEKTELIGMREYYSGNLYGKDVVMVYSKCGKVSSATTVTVLIERYNVEMVIFTGVAGAANDALNLGDVVIASGLIQHDFDVSDLIGLDKYDNSLLGKAIFDTKARNVERLRNAAENFITTKLHSALTEKMYIDFNNNIPKVVVGVIASGDQFIANRSKIKELSRGIRNLQCVEMETAAAAQICYEYSIDFLAFRIISDKADEHADISFDKFVNTTATIFTKGIIKNLFEKHLP